MSKKPSDKGTNEESDKKIPNEKFDDTIFAGTIFSPGDFGMKAKGYKGNYNTRNNCGKPE